MSRLSFDHLASLLPMESALSPPGSSSAERSEDSFRDVLQRAQGAAGPAPRADRPTEDTSRGAETDRSTEPSRPSSQDPPSDDTSAQPDRPAEKPDRPDADEEDNTEGAEEEAAVAEAGANADDDEDQDPGNAHGETDADSVIVPPEVNSVPAAEWIPGSDPAQNQATAQGERLGQCEPSSSTDPKQLDGDAALANPSVGAAQEEPVSGDEQAAGQPGEHR